MIDGQKADVVTLALAYDIDVIAERRPASCQLAKPASDNSAPYTSTVVFLCEKEIQKHSSTGKIWSVLAFPSSLPTRRRPAARAGTISQPGATRCGRTAGVKTRRIEFIKALYKNVPVLDAGARGATTTFIQNGIGDVLIAWENEAYLALARPEKTRPRS